MLLEVNLGRDGRRERCCIRRGVSRVRAWVCVSHARYLSGRLNSRRTMMMNAAVGIGEHLVDQGLVWGPKHVMREVEDGDRQRMHPAAVEWKRFPMNIAG